MSEPRQLGTGRRLPAGWRVIDGEPDPQRRAQARAARVSTVWHAEVREAAALPDFETFALGRAKACRADAAQARRRGLHSVAAVYEQRAATAEGMLRRARGGASLEALGELPMGWGGEEPNKGPGPRSAG